MSRIATPASIDEAPEGSRALLENVKKAVGQVPNLYRLTAQSPAALEGMLSFSGALGKGVLDAATRERIALAVAQITGCDYCLAAHSFLAKNVAKLDDAEIEANRRGGSADAKADAAVKFAIAVVEARGSAPADAVEAARTAGHSDAELVEIVAHVALNTFTNYMNEAFVTAVDFPVAKDLVA
ncbi:MAG: carboxymuconolactone decarboxylase family protein [Pseudomonadota bacterium]